MKFTDFLVDTKNPEALDATLQQMGAVLIGGPKDFIKRDGYFVMRVLGNAGFVKFACENQGYCKVIRELSQEESA